MYNVHHYIDVLFEVNFVKTDIFFLLEILPIIIQREKYFKN